MLLLCCVPLNPVVWTYVTQRLTHINEQRAPFKVCSNISPTVQNAYGNIAFSPNSWGVWRINQLMFIQCFREQRHRISTKYIVRNHKKQEMRNFHFIKGKSLVLVIYQAFHSLVRSFIQEDHFTFSLMLLRVTFQQLLTGTSINSFSYHQAAGKNIITLLVPSCTFLLL